jgi:hypothetical protein
MRTIATTVFFSVAMACGTGGAGVVISDYFTGFPLDCLP